jgi:hypothetical protein
MTLKCWFLGGGLALIAALMALLSEGLLLPLAIPMFAYALKMCGVKM